jgi:hypothetical protein
VLVASAEPAGGIDVAAAEHDRDAARERLEAAEAEEGPDSTRARRARRDLADAENRLNVAHTS